MAVETVCIATLVALHGVKGALKARLEVPEDALPDELEELQLVDAHGRQYPVRLEVLQFTQPGQAIIQLVGYTTREAAQLLKGHALHVRADELLLAPAQTDTLPQVEGYTVMDSKEGAIGAVEAVLDRPGQPLLQVRSSLPGFEGREILIPWHMDLVVDVDAAQRHLTLRLPNGLLAVYLEEPPETDGF